MFIRILSDSSGTRAVNAETGEAIENIVAITWSAKANAIPTVSLTLQGVEADVIGQVNEDAAKPEESKSQHGYAGPIVPGALFHWEADSADLAVVEVTRVDESLGTVYTKLIAGHGPQAEVGNTITRFRKHCSPVSANE